MEKFKKSFLSHSNIAVVLLGFPLLIVTAHASENIPIDTLSTESRSFNRLTGSPQAQSITGIQLAEQKKSKTSSKTKSKSSKKVAKKKKHNRALHLGTKNRNAKLLQTLLTAELAGQRGMIPTAVKNYLKAAELSRDPNIAERAARIAVYARDNKRALKAARLWVELSPLNTEARQVLAALLVRSNKSNEALEHLETVIADGTQDEHQSYMLITSLLSKEKDKQAALKVMEKLVQKRTNNPNALYAYGHLALLVGEYKKAEKAINKVIELKEDWSQSHILLANILGRQGRDKDALEQLKRAVDNQPDKHELRLFYARKLVDEKQLSKAREQFRELDDHPDKSIRGDAIYALGLLSLQLSEKGEASDYFKRLVELGLRANEANYYLGQIEERDGDVDQAIEYYGDVKYGDHNIDARIRIAVLTARMGKVAQARERLRNIEAKTADIELRLYLAEGEILRQDKQLDEAFNLYTEALAELPENIELLYARALTAEKLDRIDVAVQDLKAITERQPNNAQALNALGYTMIDRTEQIDEGVKFIERAYQINSTDAAIIDSMGWAYYRQGRYDESMRFLRKAFEMNKDAEIAAHLGEVMWVSGDHDGAREVWEEALRETPSHKILLDVIKRFTK